MDFYAQVMYNTPKEMGIKVKLVFEVQKRTAELQAAGRGKICGLRSTA
jgi:hypothetical protein